MSTLFRHPSIERAFGRSTTAGRQNVILPWVTDTECRGDTHWVTRVKRTRIRPGANQLLVKINRAPIRRTIFWLAIMLFSSDNSIRRFIFKTAHQDSSNSEPIKRTRRRSSLINSSLKFYYKKRPSHASYLFPRECIKRAFRKISFLYRKTVELMKMQMTPFDFSLTELRIIFLPPTFSFHNIAKNSMLQLSKQNPQNGWDHCVSYCWKTAAV